MAATTDIYGYTRIGARWGTTDQVDDIRIDAKTNAVQVLSYAHHEIHEGDAFLADYADIDMATTETISIGFKAPNTTRLSHMIVLWSAKVAGNLTITEGATWDVSTGTQLAAINRNRNSATVTTLLESSTGAFAAGALEYNPTGVAGGAVISTVHAFGAVSRPNPAASRDNEEFVIKAGTTYLIKFTAVGNTNAGQLILDWYEHTNSH